MSAKSENRVRTLTQKAKEQYDAHILLFNRRLVDLISGVEKCLLSLQNPQTESELTDIQTELRKCFSIYETVSQEYLTFLHTTRTEESLSGEKAHKLVLDSLSQKVHVVLHETMPKSPVSSDKAKSPASPQRSKSPVLSQRTKSAKTARSKNSVKSTASAILIRQKAKAEAAKVRLKFAEQEAQIEKQRAVLEAELKLLSSKREVDEAEAELRAISEAMDDDISCRSSDVNSDDIQERTSQFVLEQNAMPTAKQETVLPIPSHHAVTMETRNSNLDPNAYTFVPANKNQMDICAEFSRFIVKKDLLLSRLTRFDDKSEFYAAWEASFRSIMNELNVTPMEELDLLVKWLGPESTKFAQSIRSANAGNPHKGLERIWERLHDRYACPETIENSLRVKLATFPNLTTKDYKRLFELSDIVSEIESFKEHQHYGTLLAYYDSSSGVIPIVSKLPYNLQEKWTTEATKYKKRFGVPHPPFSFFSQFLRDMAKMKNDPSFSYDTNVKAPMAPSVQSKNVRAKPPFIVRKTETSEETETSEKTSDDTTAVHCPFHDSANHSLNRCRAFRAKPLSERKTFLQNKGICTRCCGPKTHLPKHCTATVRCYFCKASNHPTALHVFRRSEAYNHGEEGRRVNPVNAACTQVCRNPSGTSKSCAKTVLINIYPEGHSELRLRAYAIIDDQSSHSLARTQFFEHFGIRGPEIEYALSSCSGLAALSGRRASGFIIESLDGANNFKLPSLIECDQIPNMRNEIPSPEVAMCHPHLQNIVDFIPEIDADAQILMLIGRDLLPIHHVLDQRIGSPHSPYAQKLPLGWVIVGETCLGSVHQPDTVSVNKTFTLQNGRTTLLEPCPNAFQLKDRDCDIGNNVFAKTKQDDCQGLSVNDKEFISIMDKGFSKDPNGKWTAPLPFRKNRQRLPNNRSQALKRAKMLDVGLQKNSIKKEHMLEFMKNVISNGHAEVATDLDEATECWYLPLFAVYHPKKPDRVRCVFDSSSKHEGVSLNDVLLTGPDLINSLLGILLRFRKHAIAVTADIEQMFYCFSVHPDHRNFLRFLWYRDNNPDLDLIDYRMTVHVFGNSPSPAVANYGLRKTVKDADTDVKDFVSRNFYVDDGLVSCPREQDAIDLMTCTRQVLLDEGKLRLHKLASNSLTVLNAFPQEDLAKDIHNLDLDLNTVPLQRSLGLNWDISQDIFTFRVSFEPKAFTKRGVLSTINSLYDPVGFVAPVVVRGKILLRELMTEKTDWDDALPNELRTEWETWRDSLKALETVRIPRTYTDISLLDAVRKELHIFSDASKDAIAAVAYMRVYDINGMNRVGFVLGKAKVAPSHGHTIPRLELCAAVLAVELKETILDQLDILPDSTHMYTDSKVVLGYIHNENRRFFVYVGNRVDRIRYSTKPDQWNYVPTSVNPADLATRSVSAELIQNSHWLLGPDFLSQDTALPHSDLENFDIVDADSDKEIRPLTTKTLLTNVATGLGTKRFERFSTWKMLVDTILRLQHIAKCFKGQSTCHGWHTCRSSRNVDSRRAAELFVLREVQRECFPKEITCLMERRPLPHSSSILPLSPFLDKDGILRVGGRLNRAKDHLTTDDTNPIIVPKHHHITVLLIRHFHESVRHQGRHFTEGAIRSAGYWIIGGRRLISSAIHRCVICRKLRGRMLTQKMANLPTDRLQPSPPFTYVGVDTFGPWSVTSRRTRGGHAQSKRWAVLFTCLVCRAAHIEVVEELTSASFINALRRFVALRGPVQEYRSDRGTNFVGAVEDLNFNVVRVEDGPVNDFLYENGSTWIFNPPHSSHMGGVWERMIGTSRRILDSMLSNTANLSHEVLTTLMAEVCAIINARPILPVSSDPEAPSILTPSVLLTQKTSSEHKPFQPMDIKDAYRSTWKRVQYLADEFWRRWRKEYLQSLQTRQKWTVDHDNVKQGDVILLKDAQCSRNDWPIGIVQKVFPSEDNRVRTAEIRISRDGKPTVYVRPISELVLLLSK